MTLKKAYVETSLGQIHYRYDTDAATTHPPLVLLHKSASSSRMYEAMMERLAPQFHVYALDTPGFGASYDPPVVPDSAYYVAVLLEAIERLGIGLFHLLGHHTGACFGGEMAVLAPQRVASLTMIGPAVLTAAQREQFRGHYSQPFNQPVADGSHLQKTWDYLARMGGAATLELQQRELLDHARAWRGRTQAYTTVWDQDFAALYQQISCPMLLMCAPDDVLFPYYEAALAARPDARSALVAGANFEPDIDPDGCVEALYDFLA